MQLRLTDQPIDPAVLSAALKDARVGAFTSYEGWVRENNRSRQVTSLEYTAYPELASEVGKTLLEEVDQKYDLIDAVVVHRTGSLNVGDIAVYVGITAKHRDHAFLACRYLIDNVKYRLPIWKKETYANGESFWIANNDCGCADSSNLDHEH